MSDVPPDADIAAMQRLAAGDDHALNELMERWGDKVAAFLLHMTGDRAAATDLTEEAFVRLYQHRGAYTPSGLFATYLFRIAANLARNHERWRRRHPTVALEDLANAGGDEVWAAGASGDQLLDRREQMHVLESALAVLPDDQREALLLFSYEGMSCTEIAQITGSSPKAVEMRIYRARQTLKGMLDR